MTPEKLDRDGLSHLYALAKKATVARGKSLEAWILDHREFHKSITPDEFTALIDKVRELQSARIAYASEFPFNSDGEHDVGNIHANIRALKDRVRELEVALSDLLPLTEEYAVECSRIDKSIDEMEARGVLSDRIISARAALNKE